MLDPDLDEYLTEYRLQAPAEPIGHYEGNLFVSINFFTFLFVSLHSCVPYLNYIFIY